MNEEMIDGRLCLFDIGVVGCCMLWRRRDAAVLHSSEATILPVPVSEGCVRSPSSEGVYDDTSVGCNGIARLHYANFYCPGYALLGIHESDGLR